MNLRLKWPDDLDKVVRCRMEIMRDEGTTGVSIDTLFNMVASDVKDMDNSPRGTNAGWVVKNTLRELTSKGAWPLAILK